MGGMFLTVFTTAALGVVVYYLLQRLKVTEAHLALLDRKSRQNVDIGEVKSLLRNEIPNLRTTPDPTNKPAWENAAARGHGDRPASRR